MVRQQPVRRPENTWELLYAQKDRQLRIRAAYIGAGQEAGRDTSFLKELVEELAKVHLSSSAAKKKEGAMENPLPVKTELPQDAADKAAGAAEQKLRDALAAAQAKLDALKKEMEAQIAQKNKELENLHKQLTEEIQKEQKMHDGLVKDSEQALRDAQAKAATDAEKEAKEHADAIRALQEQLEKLRAERNAKVQELTQELAKVRHPAEVDIANKDAANREALARLQQENATRIQALQDGAAAEKNKLMESLSEKEKSLVTLKKSTDDAIAEREKQVTMIREEHTMQLESMRKTQSDELGKLKESHMEQVKTRQMTIVQMKETHTRTVDTHAAQLAELQKKMDAQLAAKTKELSMLQDVSSHNDADAKDRIAELEHQLEQAKKMYELKVAELQADLDAQLKALSHAGDRPEAGLCGINNDFSLH